MASIRSKNTRPELTIRKILWSRGIRYRIHDNRVFGKPDISFSKQRLAIFIDGCFWHACKKCYNEPRTNTIFWRKKITQNQKRRKIVKNTLKKTGWAVLEFWEHEIKNNPKRVTNSIESKIKLTDI